MTKPRPQGDEWKYTGSHKEPGLGLRKFIAALVALAAMGLFFLSVVWPVVGVFMKP